MRLGRKSVLFGAHQFIIHALFVAWAWTNLFGFPWDIRLWFAFFLHDAPGYWNCYTMDGEDGVKHPEAGARIMGRLFGEEWASFCIRHSRSYAKLEGKPVSALCAADKYAMILEPKWLYLFRVKLTGEYLEYIAVNAAKGLCAPGDVEGWYTATVTHLTKEVQRIAESVKYGSGDINSALADWRQNNLDSKEIN